MRTVRAFGKELSEVSKYTQKTDLVYSLAKKEAVIRAGFFGVVSVSPQLINNNTITKLVFNFLIPVFVHSRCALKSNY